MAVQFNYTDYLLYAAANDVNENLYTSVIAGVLAELKNQYGIYIDIDTLDYVMFLDSTVIRLPISPVTSINLITYDSEVVPVDTYTWYGRDIVFSTPFTDYRKPVTFNVTVGYTEVPADLKLAVYRHIDSIIFALMKHTDNIAKILNNSGNTAYYRDSQLPLAVKQVYDFYSTRVTVLS